MILVRTSALRAAVYASSWNRSSRRTDVVHRRERDELTDQGLAVVGALAQEDVAELRERSRTAGHPRRASMTPAMNVVATAAHARIKRPTSLGQEQSASASSSETLMAGARASNVPRAFGVLGTCWCPFDRTSRGGRARVNAGLAIQPAKASGLLRVAHESWG